MKSLTAILKPTELKEDVENTCDDAFACLDEIVTMCNNLVEGLQDVDDEMDESMMNCISSSREHIKSACECALEAYGFDACCDTCDDEEEEAVKEAKMKDILPTGEDKSYLEQFMKKLNALRKEFPRVIIRGHYDKTVEAGLLDKETGNVIRIGKDIDFSINESEKDMGISKDDEEEVKEDLSYIMEMPVKDLIKVIAPFAIGAPIAVAGAAWSIFGIAKTTQKIKKWFSQFKDAKESKKIANIIKVAVTKIKNDSKAIKMIEDINAVPYKREGSNNERTKLIKVYKQHLKNILSDEEYNLLNDIYFASLKEEKDMGISKDDETEFHKELDDLVHNTFGKRKDENVELEESFRPGYDMVPAPIGKDTYRAKGLKKLWGTKMNNGKWADYYVAMYDDGKIGIVNQQGVNRYSTAVAFKKGFEKFRKTGNLDESMNEATGAHSMGTATVTFIGSRLNGKKVDIFHKFPDGRINVQYRKSDKRGDVINLTLKKGQYELNEAESKQKTHMIGMWLEKTLKVLEKIVKDISINAVEHGNLEKGVRYIISATKGTPFEEEFKKLSDLGHGREYDKALIKLLTDIQDYYVDMNEAVSQKVKIGSKVKGIMGVHGHSSGTVVRFGSDRGKKIVYVKSPDGKEWDTTEWNIRVVDKLDEAKKVDEPEEAGLKDYVMPKSVTKMLAKQQFNRVKAGTKLYDAVSKVDKAKDLLHLYTSKKHKNILIGMFMIGKKASFFIHDTEAKSQRLDNVGRYKDLKGFVAALNSKFEGGEKNESAKKPLTKILGEADETPRALAFIKLLEKHGFVTVPKENALYKKYNKSGKLLGLYAIPMRAGKYADIHIGVTSELVTDSYFITDGNKTKSFDNVADLTTYLKKLVASNSLNKLVEDATPGSKKK